MSDYTFSQTVSQPVNCHVDIKTGEIMPFLHHDEGVQGLRAEARAGCAHSLVLNGGIASKLPEGQKNTAFDRVKRRFELQDVVRKLLPGEAVKNCLRWRFNQNQDIGIHFSASVKRAHFSNLQTCGLPWICPVCSAKISERRRSELDRAVNLWKSAGNSVFLSTFTMRHNSADGLDHLLQVLNEGYRGLKSGRFWQEFTDEFGVVGSVSSLEITYGQSSGFHPHKHVLFFCEGVLNPYQVGEIQILLSRRWQNVLQRFSGFASLDHGVNVQLGDSAVAGYTAKDWNVVSEVTKTVSKSGRVDGQKNHYSPFQLLDLVEQPWARSAFCEYAKFTKGKKLLVWSRGLRDLFDLGEELTDQEVVELQEQPAILLVSLSMPDWCKILKNRARAELLEVASTGRLELVYIYLESLGIQPERGSP